MIKLFIKTKVVIVIPEPDIASNTIWKGLENGSHFKESNQTFDSNMVFQHEKSPDDIKVVFSKKDGVESNHLEKKIQADLFIVASRHRAASGTPALLIHPTGNWSKITLAGRERELSYTSCQALKFGLLHLQNKKEEYGLENYKVDLEVTHHGPTSMKCPLIFMELGSSEDQWKDEKAAKAVGEAIVETAQQFINTQNFKGECFIGLGGNHYAYRFHKYLMQNENAYISHMAAKHTLGDLDKENISQAFTKTLETPVGALIDKKGARSEQRKNAIELLESLGKEYFLI